VADAKWTEISLVVDGELAEAVAEVLNRYTSGGVVVESNVKYNDAEDEGTPYGPVKVYGYLINDDQHRKKPATGWKKLCGICKPFAPARPRLPTHRR